MTPRQEQFVREYLIDLNATQAAIRAGYSAKTARQIGERLLTYVDVAEAIRVAMAERSRRTQITGDRVLEELAKIAFFDIREAFSANGTLKPLDEMTPTARAVIANLDVSDVHDRDGNIVGRLSKVRLADKVAVLTLLMRHLGMLNDKIKVQGDAENPLTLLIREVQGNSIRPVPSHMIENEDRMLPVQ
ncbi:MAG: terminase small subunit [Pseudomonadota bacterium]